MYSLVRRWLPYVLIPALVFLPWFSGYNRVSASYGHTIALNGGNDFYGNETFFTSTRTPTYYLYITWDSSNLYVAYRGDEINKDDARFTNQSQKWVQMYIGGENGTTTGSPYRTQQPTLPFSAKYHVRWKIDETYFNVQQYNGSSWVDTAGSFGYYRDANSPFVKFKIPLSAIGNPTTLKFSSFLLEETAGNERMWAAFPEDAFSDGYDRNVNTYYQFDLQSDSVSTRQVSYNFNSTSVTSNAADFSFNASSGASSVKIQQSTDGAVWTDAEMKQPLSASSTTGQVTSLAPGTAYKFRLVVTGGTSQGSSEVVDVTTPAGTPVSDLAKVSVTNTTASFTWTPAAGASSVTMLQSADNGGTWTTAAAGALTAGSGSATVTNLTPHTPYLFRLFVEGGSRSGNSNTVSLTTLYDASPPGSPSNLSFTQMSQSSFTLQWEAASDDAGVVLYEVYRDGISLGTTAALSMPVTGAAVGQSYRMTVVAVDGDGNRSAESAPLFVTLADTTSPAAPAGLTETDRTDTTVTVEWTASTDNVGVTEYEVLVDGVVVGTTSGTDYTVTGLDPETAYQVTVQAKDAAGNVSEPSGALTVTTDSTPVPQDTTKPSAPAGVTETARTDTSVTIEWTASTDNVGVTEYEVLVDGVVVGTTSGTDYTVTGLDPETAYDITVQAKDAAGNVSDPGGALTVTTDSTPVPPDTTKPSAPAGVTETARTDTSVTIEWTASTDNVGVTEYEVLVDGVVVGTTSGTDYTVTGLDPETAYDITVQAKDAAGNVSDPGGALTVTTEGTPVPPDTTKPSAPTGLTETARTDTSVTIEWTVSTDNVGVTEYEVLVDGVVVGTTSGTDYTVTGLDPETAYDITVRAKDAAGNVSEPSGALTVTTVSTPVPPDTTKPSAPTGLTETARTDTTVTVEWTASTDNVGVTEYEVLVDGVVVGTTSGTDYTVTGLDPETAYQVTVQAKDAAGNVSEPSGALTVTTEGTPTDSTPADSTPTDSGPSDGSQTDHSPAPVPEDHTAPSAPTGVTVTEKTETTITLEWNPPPDGEGVTEYEVLVDGIVVGTTEETGYEVPGLEPSTEYEITVRAKDAAGNPSADSDVLKVVTASRAASSVGRRSGGGAGAADCSITRIQNRIIIDGCFSVKDNMVTAAIGESVLDSGLDAVLAKENEIIFDTLLQADRYLIRIPSELAQKYQGMGTIFHFSYVDQAYRLESEMLVLPPQQYSSSPNQAATAKIGFLASDLPDEDQSEVERLASANGMQIRNSFRSFTIFAEVGGEQELLSFKKGMFITRLIQPDADINMQRVTGLLYSSPTTFSYAPYRRGLNNGETELLQFRNGGVYGMVGYHTTFPDISNHWGRASIELLASKWIVFGRTEHAFVSDDEVTRAEFASLLVRVLDLRPLPESSFRFSDVSDSSWYYTEVRTARHYGIIEGYEDGTFRPGQPISRAEMAAMMAKMIAKEFPQRQTQKALTPADEFKDYLSIGPYYTEPVALMRKAGLMEGYPDFTFRADGETTRAEAVTVLERFLEFVEFIR